MAPNRDRMETMHKMSRDRTVTSFKLGPCKRCGHSPDWHRLDDSKNISPVDPAAEFRCYGYDVEAPGPTTNPVNCATARTTT